MSCRTLIRIPAAIALLVLLSGCAGREEYLSHMDAARLYYRHKKWYDATQQFILALEKKPGDYEARIGLGNAALEHGNDLYMQAHQLAEAADTASALDLAEEGTAMHNLSNGQFEVACEMDSGRADGWYGRGRLLYTRAASDLRFPYGYASKEADVRQLQAQRMKDLENSILCYERVLEINPDTPHAQRDLGLLHFLRMDRGQSDPERGRDHLMRYGAMVKETYDRWLHVQARTEAEQRQLKEKKRELSSALEEVGQMFREYQSSLREEERGLTAKPSLTPEEQSTLEWIQRETEVTQESLEQLKYEEIETPESESP